GGVFGVVGSRGRRRGVDVVLKKITSRHGCRLAAWKTAPHSTYKHYVARGRTATPFNCSAAATASAIFGAPGVSPWMQIVCASMGTVDPSLAMTPCFFAMRTACSPAL